MYLKHVYKFKENIMPLPLLGWAAIAIGTAAVGYLLSDDEEVSQVDGNSAEKARENLEKNQKREGFNSAIKQLWSDYLMDQDIVLNEKSFEAFMKSSKTGLARLKEAFSLETLGTELSNELEVRLAEVESEQAELFKIHKKYSS